jgi:hypothetical protein
MNLQHEAILSLNTRVRRLRYLYKAIDLVSDVSLTRQILVNEMTKYGFSRSLYDEVKSSPLEPFSGHFFEHISSSYEKIVEKQQKRRSSNAQRVADSYITLGLRLGLLADSGQRIAASQLSMPMRFLANFDRLPQALKILLRSQYVLTLLWRYDRDLTCPLLSQLYRSASPLETSTIESHWNRWEQDWLNTLIDVCAKQGFGNPGPLLRYRLLAAKTRKKPDRYAEHTALIRFHWFIDLGLAQGQPIRNPIAFIAADGGVIRFHEVLNADPSYLVTGDIGRIHFQICRMMTLRPDARLEISFSEVISGFLKAAKAKGVSNVRLSLLDILWGGIVALSSEPLSDFDTFCGEMDHRIKNDGIAIIKAPRRDESYIPTTQ